MATYLLEIGTEELPADQVPEAQERLQALLEARLNEQCLAYESIEAMGTPRRLAVIVTGLPPVQPTTTKKVKGPPVKSSFSADGKPLPPACGFAQKQGLAVEALDREVAGGVEYLVANLTIPGREARAVLAAIVPAVIGQISGERLMRWGCGDMKFSRPIRWIVSLLDHETVAFEMDSLRAGNITYGHRILSPGGIVVAGPAEYVETLRKACVIVCPLERRQAIESRVRESASSVGGLPRQLKGDLLDEVVNITEWPHAVLGQFEPEYLDLPDALIETVMVHHQRYFPVESAGGKNGARKLLPYFVTVANNDRQEAQPLIRKGNERVLRARLADGRFFYFDDQKQTLAGRKPQLAQLTFQEGLGSYADKQERLVAAARALAEDLGLAARISVCLERTMELCKLDLVTGLVRELPELQGYVGSWYAASEGAPPEVVAAIASHYSPRSTDDAIPADVVGRLAAVLDKIDNLTGLFALGKKPSGSSDPFALRRQAQGLVDILIDGLPDYPIDVDRLIERFFCAFKPCLSAARVKGDPRQGIADLRDFVAQRLKVKLNESGYRREVVEAVLAAGNPIANMPDAVLRCRAIESALDSQRGIPLVRAGVRIGNILGPDSPDIVDPQLLVEGAERSLWEAFTTKVVAEWGEEHGAFRHPSSGDDYARLLDLLAGIAPFVDRFFDDVMVNDPDREKRNNRHGLLKHMDRYFRAVADFPKLQPLLP